MTRSVARFGLVIMLAFAALSLGGRPVAGQDERADLKVEFLGVPLSGTQQQVTIRVTNISVWWADETQIKIETVSPSAGNAVSLFVENLDPGQVVTFTYALAGACNGHVVKAEVTPAKNWAGIPEGNTANNRVQQQVCPVQTQGADPNKVGVVTKPRIPTERLIPEHLRPGTHTLEIEPSELFPIEHRREVTQHTPKPAYPPLGTWVGFSQWESDVSILENHEVRIAQTVFKFDMRMFDEVPRKLVTRAVIEFDEQRAHPHAWRNAEGDIVERSTCVESLNRLLAPSNVRDARGFPLSEYLVDTEPYQPLRPRGNVTGHFLRLAQFPDDMDLRHGFVLRGAHDDVAGDDNESCMSEVSNIRLEVTYVVPTQ